MIILGSCMAGHRTAVRKRDLEWGHGKGPTPSCPAGLSSYTSILGDIWLWLGVPWATSALAALLSETSRECLVPHFFWCRLLKLTSRGLLEWQTHLRMLMRSRCVSQEHTCSHRQSLLRVEVFSCVCTSRFSASGVGSHFKNNYPTEMCSGSEEGSYLRLIDLCITRLWACE